MLNQTAYKEKSMFDLTICQKGSFILKICLVEGSFIALITNIKGEVLWTQKGICPSIQVATDKGFAMIENFVITEEYLLSLKHYYKKCLRYQKEQNFSKAYFYLKKVLFCIRRFLIRKSLGFWYFIPNKQKF